MGLLRGHHRYTYADYVALELESTIKHEFFDGEIYAMAGGSEDHSALAAEVQDDPEPSRLHRRLSPRAPDHRPQPQRRRRMVVNEIYRGSAVR